MSQILQILQTHRETSDSLLISMGIPTNLRKQFRHAPGQFITLEAQINGKTFKRPYSLCGSIDQQEELSILVKRVQGGVVSNFLNDHAEIGNSFKVHAPQGNFKVNPWLLNMNQYVFFAAGCGITPIISMIENIMKKEMFSKALLFYSSKTWQSTIFRERLKALWEAYPGRFQFQMIFTAEAAIEEAVGRLNKTKCEKYLNQHLKSLKKGKYFLCGPTGFMEDIMTALLELQVPSHNIHFESFSGVQLSAALTASRGTTSLLPALDTSIEVMLDKKLHKVAVNQSQMILDSVLQADLDANYSCRSGNCSSCKAKLISGQITSKPSTGLSKKEIEAGYILTCQSQPASPDVKIEYCQ